MIFDANLSDIPLMKRLHTYLFLFCLVSAPAATFAQCGGTFKVLHYTETTGYDHNTRSQSLSMFQSWESADDFVVTTDNNGDEFNSLSNLQQYAVVVFSNTSGDNGLNSTQRANFEAYINGGGSYLGIHAASDTYRHSTANGGSTGTWDWYAENVAGATVQQSPNHTSQNHNNTMTHEEAGHPTLTSVPSPWNKTEEYYYWENGYLNNSFTELLRVGSTGGNSYDAARMMAHCKDLSGGGRAFYTALGHSGNNYTNDQNFQQLIRNALNWVAEPNKGGGGSGGFDLVITVTDEIICFDGSARIRADPTNGTAPYTYSWNTGSSLRVQDGISAGTYTVQVTDGNGCVENASVTLDQPDEINLVVTTKGSNNPSAPNGSAIAVASGGTPPFSYSWTGPGGFTASVRKLENIDAGEYTVTLTDANGCMESYTAVVDNTTSVESLLGVTEILIAPNPASDQLTISGYTSQPFDASVTLTSLTGAEIKAFSIQASGTFASTIDVSDLPSGMYFVVLTTKAGLIVRNLVIQ